MKDKLEQILKNALELCEKQIPALTLHNKTRLGFDRIDNKEEAYEFIRTHLIKNLDLK